jgi:hypothetical protein
VRREIAERRTGTLSAQQLHAQVEALQESLGTVHDTLCSSYFALAEVVPARGAAATV